MRVDGYYHCVFIHSWQTFLTKELVKHDARRSLCTIVEGFFWMTYSRYTRLLTFKLHSSLHLSGLFTNGDKFCWGKLMWVVDEKLTINEPHLPEKGRSRCDTGSSTVAAITRPHQLHDQVGDGNCYLMQEVQSMVGIVCMYMYMMSHKHFFMSVKEAQVLITTQLFSVACQ